MSQKRRRGAFRVCDGFCDVPGQKELISEYQPLAMRSIECKGGSVNRAEVEPRLTRRGL
jgi:hypothetical protein